MILRKTIPVTRSSIHVHFMLSSCLPSLLSSNSFSSRPGASRTGAAEPRRRHFLARAAALRRAKNHDRTKFVRFLFLSFPPPRLQSTVPANLSVHPCQVNPPLGLSCSSSPPRVAVGLTILSPLSRAAVLVSPPADAFCIGHRLPITPEPTTTPLHKDREARSSRATCPRNKKSIVPNLRRRVLCGFQ